MNEALKSLNKIPTTHRCRIKNIHLLRSEVAQNIQGHRRWSYDWECSRIYLNNKNIQLPSKFTSKLKQSNLIT